MKAERRRGGGTSDSSTVPIRRFGDHWVTVIKPSFHIISESGLSSSKIIAATGSIARHALMVQLSSSTLIPIDFNHVCIRRSLLGKPKLQPKNLPMMSGKTTANTKTYRPRCRWLLTMGHDRIVTQLERNRATRRMR
ncbi:hypothetical protein V8E54_000452 [Elaphomyces granulatus]